MQITKIFEIKHMVKQKIINVRNPWRGHQHKQSAPQIKEENPLINIGDDAQKKNQIAKK